MGKKGGLVRPFVASASWRNLGGTKTRPTLLRELQILFKAQLGVSTTVKGEDSPFLFPSLLHPGKKSTSGLYGR